MKMKSKGVKIGKLSIGHIRLGGWIAELALLACATLYALDRLYFESMPEWIDWVYVLLGVLVVGDVVRDLMRLRGRELWRSLSIMGLLSGVVGVATILCVRADGGSCELQMWLLVASVTALVIGVVASVLWRQSIVATEAIDTDKSKTGKR